ncbi:acyl CoA:acetate/3-ketoacid CoA transferase [Paraburkholderia sp. Ac-20342]|uniref:acyl CoA:acetate/3-ketoacid CoA transferase n=1 Tax=Paraburkholderia sp. Ac-20342 TaxID=2703889 RepID=UPI001981632E|nr:CoA-transferase [Paraburkholderia sp. Ac-20342]MBN3849333.1 acyl CoA:acetate/3-ketoacid CoA transferase [Paraburkholderia sp. Ac-20342]
MLSHVQFLSPADAVSRIPDGATVAIGGTGPSLEADAVLQALQERFVQTASPRNLTVFAPALPGDRAGIGGLNCIAHEGLLARMIGASFSSSRHPALIEMIRNEACEGYVIGMGTLVQLLDAAASGKPGVHTTVGIGSFLDPRNEAGRMNARSRDTMAQVTEVAGKEYLFYPTHHIDVAIIRGTTADENGYISFEEEPNTLAMLELASATKACGGLVIAQVKRLARANSLDPKLVRIPGPLVDVVVVNPAQTQVSSQMFDPALGANPALSGSLKVPLHRLPRLEDPMLRVMMRRAALELRPNDVINIGVGVATSLPSIALEEGILDDLTFTNEHGIFGGIFTSVLGKSFVPALNADAIMDSSFQFGFYESGGLSVTFLGIGEIDAAGHVNVSKFGREWNGCGGFNSITDRTSRLVFCGSLTTGGLQVAVEDGELRIVREGRHKKFVNRVEQVTLNATRARKQGQQVLYITERAVFELGDDGPVVIEIAPGIDFDRDIQDQVGFELKKSPALKRMDSRIFQEPAMGLLDTFVASC